MSTSAQKQKHYHLTAGLSGGYLSNTSEVYATRREALAAAKWRVDDYREQGEKVRGSAKAGYWQARQSESFPGTYWDYIEVSGPCSDQGEGHSLDGEDW